MFKTTELYIWQDRNEQICLRIACGDIQTKRIVLTHAEADQLMAVITSASERYNLEVVT
jgi:hypothetical protein